MGTWGEALYDNDSALDVLADLADEIDLEASAAHLVTGVGLLAWLHPATLATHGGRVRATMDTRAQWVHGVDDRVRATLRAIHADPETFVRGRGERSAELTEILGRYEDGPREDVLLRAPGGAAVIEELAERCRARLDALADLEDDLHAVAGELAALGPLLELRVLDGTTDAERVRAWGRTFERFDRDTQDERAFWDAYAAKVRRAFDLLGG